MTDRQFEIFITLSDNLSFAKTAEALYLSQPSVTREIQALEKELGFALFHRTIKSVTLTPDGLEFKKAITPLVNSVRTTISRIKNKKIPYKHTLRMGFFHISSLKKIPQAIKLFHERYPDILPEIHQANLNQMNSMFHSGQLDLIFAVRSIMEPEKTDKIMDLFPGTFCATIPVSNPLSEYEYLTPEQLDGQEILQLNASSGSSCFKNTANEVAFGCPHSLFINCTSTDEQEVYLRAGIGIAISTDYSFIPDPAWKQIPIRSKHVLDLQTNYAVMWHTENTENHIEDFIKILQDVFSD